MSMNVIDPSQLKTVIETVCEKTKLIFVSKSELESKIATLNDTISALEARVEALENGQQSFEGEDEEPMEIDGE